MEIEHPVLVKFSDIKPKDTFILVESPNRRLCMRLDRGESQFLFWGNAVDLEIACMVHFEPDDLVLRVKARIVCGG